jgi:hypothetical protein
LLRKALWGVAASAVLALLTSMAIAQRSVSQPVDPPQQVAQLRQQYDGLNSRTGKGRRVHAWVPMHFKSSW